MKNGFPTDQLLGYNLFFSKDNHTFDLQQLGYLDYKSPSGIVYSSLKYPSFFITSTDSSSFLYGSCRKIHGKGEDFLLLGDQLLEKHQSDSTKRPSALFLTGDQIYADDVSEHIFPFINKIAGVLMGYEEDLPSIDERVTNYTNRKQISKYVCKFTSRKSTNHLFTLGEYATMYLLCFGPALWKDILPQLSNTPENVDIINFANSTCSTQRLLANIPTYMICDDHDITDDWNITKRWKENVENSPLGRHVLANALTAYFAFQGWGNDPSRFSSEFFDPLIEYVNCTPSNSHSYKRWSNSIIGFSPWTYVAPTKPIVLCLDTRTSREWSYCKKQSWKWIPPSTSGPELVNEKGWTFAITKLLECGWQKNDPLVIVSPAPLYGMEVIESFLEKYISPLRNKGIPVTTSFDLEAWRMNGEGVYHFYEVLVKLDPSEITILSGDSHMASAIEVWAQFGKHEKIKLLQLTSSPLKNESFRGVSGLALKAAIVFYNIFQTEDRIVRVCDENQYFHYNSIAENKAVMLTESIHYQYVNKKSITELTNNLGLVKFSREQTYHQLLTKKDEA
ncbi:hypothetical protein [Robertmurraya korlensis]|uniref:hypothetical protein n=1 Tax=Robertmurraya korlensis TaxID=519977 RepID=UPI00203CA5AB|nr:hypothetical protein [Robertmurraya korlensis]